MPAKSQAKSAICQSLEPLPSHFLPLPLTALLNNGIKRHPIDNSWNNCMHDINTRDDLQHIITVFYSQLLTDPIIGFFFTDIVTLDLDKHIPKIADFWAFQLLGEKNYQGNVFDVHRQLHLKAALTEDHFHRWVFVLHNTIDRLYAGQVAEAMKLKAAMIAKKMQQALANGATSYDLAEGVQVMTPPLLR